MEATTTNKEFLETYYHNHLVRSYISVEKLLIDEENQDKVSALSNILTGIENYLGEELKPKLDFLKADTEAFIKKQFSQLGIEE